MSSAPATTSASALGTDADDVRRVGGTRVTLDSIVAAFRAGATAEEIAQQYPALTLADVYEAIAHYLRHPAEVDSYLARRAAAATTQRATHEQRTVPHGVRARLLARRAAAKV